MQRNRVGVRRHTAQEESGVALIEFVLVLPLVLLLLFGMIDFGKAFNYWNDETHLANEAARYAVVNKNPFTGTPNLEDAIKKQADSAELRNGCSTCSISKPGITVTYCFVDTDGSGNPITTAGHPVRATVTAQYNWLSYLIGQGLPAHSGLGGSATMRIEQDYKPDSTNPTDYSHNAYLQGGPVACSS